MNVLKESAELRELWEAMEHRYRRTCLCEFPARKRRTNQERNSADTRSHREKRKAAEKCRLIRCIGKPITQ